MHKFSKQLARGLMVFALLAGLSACDKSPNEPKPETPDSPATQASASGVEVYRLANDLQQMEQMLSGPENLGQIQVPAVGSLSGMSGLFAGTLAPFHSGLSDLARAGRLGKINGDSLLYEARWTDLFGIEHHVWVIYNDATGKATLYLVATHPTGFLGVLRDSTQIIANLNFTISDTTDDTVEFLYNRKDFRADHILRYEEGSITPDPYSPGTEPTGGILQGKKVFAAGQDSVEVSTRLEVHEGLGGSWEKRIRFANGSSYEELVTFHADGTGSFVINYPGGRREEGTFDANADDHNVSFTKTTTFPVGYDPRILYESAAFTINPVDSSWTGTFIVEWRYAGGKISRTETQVTRTLVNGFERYTITQTNTNGTGGTLTIQEGATANTIEGSWVDEEGHYILFDGVFQHDGSGDLHLKVYASKQAYDSGAAPIFEATLHFNPDGTGSGSITSGSGQESFVFDANGQVNN